MKERYSKIDHYTIHSLPVQPKKEREKNFYMKKKNSTHEIEVSASSTINAYDLVTLILLYYEYLTREYEKISIKDDGVEIKKGNTGDRLVQVARLEIDLKEFAKKRGVKRVNKEEIASVRSSLLRLWSASVAIVNHKEKWKALTRYIYLLKFSEKDDNVMEVYFNYKLLDLVKRQGIVINLDHLLQIGKKQYATLLYLYILGTRKREEKRHPVTGRVIKKWYIWRQKYTLQELTEKLKLDDTRLVKKEQKRIIKNSLEFLYSIGIIPKYKEQNNVFWLQESDNMKLLTTKEMASDN